jgi:phosphonate transport system permease protein
MSTAEHHADGQRSLTPTPYPQPNFRQSLLRYVILALLLVTFAWVISSLDVNANALRNSPANIQDFINRAIPPDMSVMNIAVQAVLETLQIGLLGTFFSALASFPLGLLAASNLTPAWIHLPLKSFLTVIRAVPVILLALLFVSALGLGPLPGVLAVAVHSTGMLGKFYAEAFENARPGPLEALDSAAATWFQKIRYGVFTQIAPDLVRDSLFRLELNIREAQILGLVGAGGIGFYIQLYSRAFQYQKVATMTIVVIVIAVLVEQTSVAIRRRLR